MIVTYIISSTFAPKSSSSPIHHPSLSATKSSSFQSFVYPSLRQTCKSWTPFSFPYSAVARLVWLELRIVPSLRPPPSTVNSRAWPLARPHPRSPQQRPRQPHRSSTSVTLTSTLWLALGLDAPSITAADASPLPAPSTSTTTLASQPSTPAPERRKTHPVRYTIVRPQRPASLTSSFWSSCSYSSLGAASFARTLPHSPYTVPSHKAPRFAKHIKLFLLRCLDILPWRRYSRLGLYHARAIGQRTRNSEVDSSSQSTTCTCGPIPIRCLYTTLENGTVPVPMTSTGKSGVEGSHPK